MNRNISYFGIFIIKYSNSILTEKYCVMLKEILIIDYQTIIIFN